MCYCLPHQDIRSTLGTVCNLVPVKPGTDCSAVVNGYLGLGSDVLHDEVIHVGLLSRRKQH